MAILSVAIVVASGLALWCADCLLRFATSVASIDGLVAANILAALVNPWIAVTVFALLVVLGLLTILQVLFWYCAAEQHTEVQSFGEFVSIASKRTKATLERGIQAKKFMALYLLVVLPLGGVAVVGAIGASLEIPEFVVSEVMKFDGGRTAYWLLVVIAVWLNLRLALSIPALVRGQSNFLEVAKKSWIMMKWPALILTLPLLGVPIVTRWLGEGATLVIVGVVHAVESLNNTSALVAAALLMSIAQATITVVVFLVSLFITRFTLEIVGNSEIPTTFAGPLKGTSGNVKALGIGIGVAALVGMFATNFAVINSTEIRPTSSSRSQRNGKRRR